ncbi:NAD-dependent epimerase/dehydratase family protein [Arthrobacter sp. B2a2-09]|uniref:NAD-dependent epimerase/dehydratase family protein n=1 Tax=Arthrobacter sp. B2a2-09 TaxID=2952822 RepID=UPI0022CD3421|nr:NAD-dependent epimerase/dehydratase family protein [Arthrobacter sp. B2a2-09]MCZ9883700.1 NAD-dependent epimerase/dehydratase family protein [Arthrobacter sp. B2a2-09]
MRILILGGTAFLSSEIARQAVAAGHEVTCLARGTTVQPPDGATWVRADRAEGSNAYAELSGAWDAVVDVSRDPEHARQAMEELVLRAAHWTFVSSCSVYADHSTPGADEDAKLLAPLPLGAAATPESYGESKSAIEQLTMDMAGAKAHIVRAGLIGGPGDSSDRYGYWPARFAASQDPVLLPDIQDRPTQVIDVRDLAAWILTAAERGLTGTFNATGTVVPFGEYIEESRHAAGVRAETGVFGETVVADEEWLVDHEVRYWSGPESLPLWLPPGHEGFSARSNAAARARGLALRPWRETVRDTLVDERVRGLGRERKAGLTPIREQQLLEELRELSKPAGKARRET